MKNARVQNITCDRLYTAPHRGKRKEHRIPNHSGEGARRLRKPNSWATAKDRPATASMSPSSRPRSLARGMAPCLILKTAVQGGSNRSASTVMVEEEI
jgi:hypothetical protein